MYGANTPYRWIWSIAEQGETSVMAPSINFGAEAGGVAEIGIEIGEVEDRSVACGCQVVLAWLRKRGEGGQRCCEDDREAHCVFNVAGEDAML